MNLYIKCLYMPISLNFIQAYVAVLNRISKENKLDSKARTIRGEAFTRDRNLIFWFSLVLKLSYNLEIFRTDRSCGSEEKEV